MTAKRSKVIEVGDDILPRYLVGGQLAVCLARGKRGAKSSEKTGKRPRIKHVSPPPGGWLGGLPEHNGLRK